jgi:uncharacterized small protein (DUF1192 family)
MIFDDETDPKTKKPKPRALDRFSVDELKEYIGDLHDEIARVQAELAKKESHKSAVDALFKK